MNKKALVVAGGQWQVPLIKSLQSKGYEVTVVDPYDDSMGVKCGDAHIKSDVRDKEYVLSRIQDKFDLVATDQSDVSVETVGFLSSALQLKGNDIDVVSLFSNKYKSRRFAQSIGVPVPDFYQVDRVEQIEDIVARRGGDFILKPCDAQSSKGIHLIDKNTPKSLLNDYLSDALKYSFIKQGILERFVKGLEITVEGFCSDGVHKVMAMSQKKHFKMGVASCLTYPAAIPTELEEAIIEKDDLFVEKSGLSFGPTHAEYIVDLQSKQFWLIEIACRGGGTLISSDIVKWVSGFDMQEAYIQCLEGKMVDVKSVEAKKRSAELHFFDFGEGKVASVTGVETVKEMDGIIAMDIPIKVGDTIHHCVDDRSRQGFVIVTAETKEELGKRIEQIEKTIRIETENDK